MTEIQIQDKIASYMTDLGFEKSQAPCVKPLHNVTVKVGLNELMTESDYWMIPIGMAVGGFDTQKVRYFNISALPSTDLSIVFQISLF